VLRRHLDPACTVAFPSFGPPTWHGADPHACHPLLSTSLCSALLSSSFSSAIRISLPSFTLDLVSPPHLSLPELKKERRGGNRRVQWRPCTIGGEMSYSFSCQQHSLPCFVKGSVVARVERQCEFEPKLHGFCYVYPVVIR
jgi:hypothetical protein